MSSWRPRSNNPKREEYSHQSHGSNNEMYSIGTMKAGTDRSLEDSISGYTPIMVDRRGNRRFHGAFTGGFSAGYFNTVGSAQGYKAKYDTWSSSRGNKNKQMITQTPMDFMDDEDMATNTNLLMTSKPFNSLNTNSMNTIFNKTKSNVSKQFGDTMTSYLMVDKHAVFNHTKGIQLLKKCGWRTGTNIGDKSNITRLRLLLKKQDELLLNKTDHNHKTNDLLFGDHILNTKNNDNDTQNEEKTAHSTPIVSIYRPLMKTDFHGIGYDADTEDNHVDNALDEDSTPSASGQKRSNPNKNTFGPLKKKRKLLPSTMSSRHGLSALEEVEIGDDIYGDTEHAPRIAYNSFIAHSDEEDEDADDDMVLMDDQQMKSMRKQAKKIYTHSNIQQRHKSDHRARSKDGTLPIDGFEVSSIDDHYEYNLKQQLQMHSGDRHQPHSVFRPGYNECIQFKSNKMQIDPAFVHKFATIDLTVGSYLCRSVSHNKRTASNVLSSTSSIPQHVPDAQHMNIKPDISKNISHELKSRFTAQETIVNDVTMGGLRAGLTSSEHIPGKKLSMRKADALLNDIRTMFGDESAEKLLRFDVFLADKLDIEPPIDTDNKILFDDGNKTKFELDKEHFEFEEKWKELQKHKQYLYANKPRLNKKKDTNNTDALRAKKESKMTPQEAAQCNRYGSLTRKVETWIPDGLLCKRCNVRDPYLGMKHDEAQKTKPLCDSVTNKSYSEWSKSNTETITTKGEQVAAMLVDTESNKEPPILQLKQLKTWNTFLQETEHKKDTKQEQNEKQMEMKHFIDGILNDTDSESNDDDSDMHKDVAQEKKQEMSLFKSIFEDNAATESDTEQSESDEDEEEDKAPTTGLITATMPPSIKDAEEVHATKNHILEKEEEEQIIPRARKKFKFIAKSERVRKKSKESEAKFGFIGVVDQERRNRKNSNMTSIQIEHESEDDIDDDVAHVIKPKGNDMMWAVVDNDSSNSDENEGSSRLQKKKKRKKRKEKRSRKKSKHKKRKRSKHK